MSMKNVEKFFTLAKSNGELSKRLIKINSRIQEKESQDLDYNQFVKEKIMPLAQEFGVTFSVDDFVEYTKSKLPKELSDEESANVSGGVSLKTAAITFGTLLSVSLGAAAFLGMGGGLEASALDPTKTLNSSQKSRATSKVEHPKAVDNISDDEVNKMGPKILLDAEGNVYLEGKQVTDTNEVDHLKAVRDKFDQQFEQNLQEQKIVQDLTERTNNIKNMNKEERIKLKKDIRKAINSIENEKLREKLNDLLSFANNVSREMLKVEREKAQKEREKAQKLVQRIIQIRRRAENISKMDKYQIEKFIDDIDTIIKEFSTVIDVDQSTQEELSEIKDRAEQALQGIIKAEEEKIAQIREKIKNLEDIKNLSEEELSGLNRLVKSTPISTRPDDIDKFNDKLNEEFERRAKEEEAQEEQAQKAQLLELGKYVKENRITTLSDVPEEARENFIEDLNEVKENFYYDTNDISSLGEVGQTIINLFGEINPNNPSFRYRGISYLPRVVSNVERFVSSVIMEIIRGKITSMSQVPQRDIEAFGMDITKAVALLQEAGRPIPDAIGVLYKEIVSNDK